VPFKARIRVIALSEGDLLNSFEVIELLFLVDLAEVTRLLVYEDSQTPIRAANYDYVMHTWISILIVWQSVVLDLLKLYCF